MEPVRRDLLDRALAFYREFLGAGRRPRRPAETGRALGRLGDIGEMLGRYAEAECRPPAVPSGSWNGPRAPPPGPPAPCAGPCAGPGVLLKSNRFVEAEACVPRRAALRRSADTPIAADDPDGREAVAESRYFLGAVLARLGGRGAEDEAAYRSADLRQGGACRP